MEHKIFKAGGYNVTMTVTRVWDPEFAARMKQAMIEYLIRQLPELLAQRRNEQGR